MARLVVGFALVLGLCSNAAFAQVKLAWKFPEGMKSITQFDVKTHQILKIGEMPIETVSTQFLSMQTLVGRKIEDGTVPLLTSVQTFQTEVSLPGGNKLVFDSATPDKKADVPQLEPLMEAYRAIAKSKWITFLDGKNQVQSVENKAPSLDSLPDILKKQLTPETRKMQIAQDLARLPDQPVNKGDTWIRTQKKEIGGGQRLTLKQRYEYQGAVEFEGRTLDAIGVTATDVTYDADPDSPSPLKVTASDLKVTNSKGRFLFDRKRGEIVKSESLTKIEGTLRFTLNGKELPGSLDLTMESTAKLQPQ